MSNYLLRLYITGNSLNSQRAIANLLKLCREELNNKYQVEIIDVLEEPARAEREKNPCDTNFDKTTSSTITENYWRFIESRKCYLWFGFN